jgi:hypothetical protein
LKENVDEIAIIMKECRKAGSTKRNQTAGTIRYDEENAFILPLK